MIVACLMCFSFLIRSFVIFDQTRSQSFSVSVFQTSFCWFCNCKVFWICWKHVSSKGPIDSSIHQVGAFKTSIFPFIGIFNEVPGDPLFIPTCGRSQRASAAVVGLGARLESWKSKCLSVLEKGNHLIQNLHFWGLCYCNFQGCRSQQKCFFFF